MYPWMAPLQSGSERNRVHYEPLGERSGKAGEPQPHPSLQEACVGSPLGPGSTSPVPAVGAPAVPNGTTVVPSLRKRQHSRKTHTLYVYC